MAEEEITKQVKEEKSEKLAEASSETLEKPTEEKTEPKGITDDLKESVEEVVKTPKESGEKVEVAEVDEETKKLVEPEEEKPFRKTREEMEKAKKEEALKSWVPKTKLGQEVKTGKIKNIDEILDAGRKILEPEIVDLLINVQSDLISIGQSKGKFGGGKRRAWRQTQRKTKEGNVATFSAFAVVGDGNGHVGVGVGKSKETLPARDKAIRKAKLNLMKIVRGDGSFDSVGGGNTSIPFKVQGKSGSVRITFIPAAPGTGLVVADQLKKVLKLAGIKDIYTKTSGRLRTSFNLIKACIKALEKTNTGDIAK